MSDVKKLCTSCGQHGHHWNECKTVNFHDAVHEAVGIQPFEGGKMSEEKVSDFIAIPGGPSFSAGSTFQPEWKLNAIKDVELELKQLLCIRSALTLHREKLAQLSAILLALKS